MATNHSASSQEFWELHLTNEGIVDNLLDAFSRDRMPQKISYNGEGYNLTKLYETFWKQLQDRPGWFPSLESPTLMALPRIIKRGWEDERYFPTNFPKSFLEACCFKSEPSQRMLANMLSEEDLDILEQDEKNFIRKHLVLSESKIDEESLKMLISYCPDTGFSSDISLHDACVMASNTIMEKSGLGEVIRQWNEELDDLMELEEFNFLMRLDNNRQNTSARLDYDDISPEDEEMLPHNLWPMYFYKWTKDEVIFYFEILKFKNFECSRCENKKVRSKHILGSYREGSCWADMNTVRQDTILNMIDEEMRLRAEGDVKGPFFQTADDWKVVKRLESKREAQDAIPEEFKMTDKSDSSLNLRGKILPHLIIYSMKLKKIMIIEVSVMWEKWKNLLPERRMFKCKEEELEWFVKELQSNGFEVHFKDIEIGCRGVFSKKLYQMFDKDFGMEHGKISKTMENISKEVIQIPYAFHKRCSRKRKAETSEEPTMKN